MSFVGDGDMTVTVVSINDVLREIERRILGDFMDLLILSTLYGKSGQVGGYDVLKYLQLKYGFLFSPGTVYSCLYDMERRGFLRGSQKGRKRIYALTKHGEETANAVLNAKARIASFLSLILNGSGDSNSLRLSRVAHAPSKEF